MAQGKVGSSAADTGSGPILAVERSFLFIGEALDNIGVLQPITAQSDLDIVCGAGTSPLKTQLSAWIANGDELISGYAIAHNSGDDIATLINSAINKKCKPEVIVICEPVTSSAQLVGYQTQIDTIKATNGLFVQMLVAAPGPLVTDTWAAYITAITPLVTGVTATGIAVTPLIFGNEIGALAGRLCKREVTIADKAMRYLTGVMNLLPVPVDVDDVELDNAVTGALDALRFSCVQWYDADGPYFGDVNTLAPEGSDYKHFEIGRVVNAALRRVKVRAKPLIGNRKFNKSTRGHNYALSKLLPVLETMAEPVKIAGVEFPGLINKPTDKSINITWLDSSTAQFNLLLKPFYSASTILVSISLDNANG